MGFRTKVYGDFPQRMTKASLFFRKKGALIFFKGRHASLCPGSILPGLIIYCIRYIEYAKVEKCPGLPILGESVKGYSRGERSYDNSRTKTH